jgi:hypothetical protein
MPLPIFYTKILKNLNIPKNDFIMYNITWDKHPNGVINGKNEKKLGDSVWMMGERVRKIDTLSA